MVNIVAIGKKHETWLVEGIERYQKRLKAPFNVEWVTLRSSAQKAATAAEDESGRILHGLKPDDFVVLLDERGQLLDSPTLSKKLSMPLEQSKKVIIIIGGAYGVGDKLRTRADLIWSLSPLVFPHQLVRLLLVEQLYRAQSIHCGLPYHNK